MGRFLTRQGGNLKIHGKWRYTLLCVAGCFLATVLHAKDAERGFLVIRGGYSDHFNNTQLDDRYHQAEAALTVSVPLVSVSVKVSTTRIYRWLSEAVRV